MLPFPIASHVFHILRKWLLLGCVAVFPVLFAINAPFGRFAPVKSSLFVVDGIWAWMAMEIAAPLSFLLTFAIAPLETVRPVPLTNAQLCLAALFLLHYTNRAIISPLRTPSRSKTHIVVTLCGIPFNVINGFLQGAYLSSFATQDIQMFSVSSCVGVVIWICGFLGNIAHDEILLNIRRKSNKKVDDSKVIAGEHYAIPQGLLYLYISYPNYLCEWIEWLGFALAAAPLTPSFHALNNIHVMEIPSLLLRAVNQPASSFALFLSPPWIFLFSEIVIMFPRAYQGHKWYHTRFGNAYPKRRKAVVPFII